MKQITINGKQYPAAFDMQTILNFEEITGRSFFTAPFTTLSDKVAVIVAAVFSADANSDISVDAIIGNKDWNACKQILVAFNVVSEEMTAFFPVPEVEKKDEPETTEEEGPKN